VKRRLISSLVVSTAVIVVWIASTVLAQQTQLPTPRRIKDVRPVYPRESLQAGDEGVIVVELSIGAGGSVEGTRILWSGCKRLEEAAVSAARQWRFEPIRVNGKPAPFKTVADIPFSLPTAFKSRAGRNGACKWTEPPKPIA
jgi:TonB family protein